MNILFLDIDGVLNSHEWYEKNVKQIHSESSMFWRSVAELDPAACALINKFCEEEELKIVITSTWRKLHDVFQIEAMFKKKGLFAEVFDKTPDLKGKARGYEIQEYLDNTPGIEKYVILDDDSDMLTGQQFVRTRWTVGVQPDDIEIAKEVLNGRISSIAI